MQVFNSVVACWGGIPEVFKHGDSAFLTGVGDVNSISEGVVYLLENPDERKRLGDNAYERVREYCDIRKTVEMTLELYRETIE